MKGSKIGVKFRGEKRNIVPDDVLAAHFDLQHLAIAKNLELDVDYSWHSLQPALEFLLFLIFHLIYIDKYKYNIIIKGRHSDDSSFYPLHIALLSESSCLCLPLTCLLVSSLVGKQWLFRLPQLLLLNLMLNYNDQRLFNLPLQMRDLPFSDKSNRPEERPKQIQNDQYRTSLGKENRIKVERLDHCKAAGQFEQKIKLESPQQNMQATIVTSSKKNRNESLRNIIKKQLFSNEKSSINKINPRALEVMIEDSNSNNKPINRYQQLLCQVYGEPKPAKIKNNKKVTNPHHASTPSIKRQASVRTIPRKEKNELERYRSATSLKEKQCLSQVGSVGSGSTVKLSEPTYMQLYMQKRRPFLFL